MRKQFFIFRLGAVLGFVLLASACGDSKKDVYVERPVEELYNQAMDKFNDSNYRGATTDFDEVDRQHPYSVWATKAQLMSAYSLYQSQKYDEALVALDRFIQLHPGNRDAAYAYYLKSLCYYIQITDVGRDQKMTEQALKALDEVVRRFPDSKYARDARLKIDLTRDHLAGKEMDIGRWYERQGQYLAAINRFRRVVDNFQTTTHVPEALHRLTESYLALGIIDEARTAAAVLGHNYPGSEWYQDSYALLTGIPAGTSDEASSKSWMTRIIGSVF
jgi:outer membrane protein assembly factor BamD